MFSTEHQANHPEIRYVGSFVRMLRSAKFKGHSSIRCLCEFQMIIWYWNPWLISSKSWTRWMPVEIPSNLETDQSGFINRITPSPEFDVCAVTNMNANAQHARTHARSRLVLCYTNNGTAERILHTTHHHTSSYVLRCPFGRPMLMPVRVHNGWIPQPFWLKKLVSNTNGHTQQQHTQIPHTQRRPNPNSERAFVRPFVEHVHI